MKKTLKTITIFMVAVLMLFTSCNDKLQRLDEGSVNEYIFPYLKFQKADDGEGVKAYVMSGAAVEKVTIPGEVQINGDILPVKDFIGFADPADASNLKEIVLESADTVLDSDVLLYSDKIESITIGASGAYGRWGKLPDLEKDGYEFLGWFAGDERIYEGMLIIPEASNAVPMWRPHTYIDHPGKAPTCTEPGWNAYRTCATCDWTDKVIIPALGHKMVHHSSVAVGCTEPGNIEYWECTREGCGRMFTDAEGKNEVIDVLIPATGHKLKHYTEIAATCLSEGLHERWQCERCRKFFADDQGLKEATIDSLIIPKIEHDWSGPWHTDDSYHWHVCPMCEMEGDKASHTWDEGRIDRESTADKNGITVYTCTVCGFEKRVEVPHSSHKWEEHYVKAPSCTEQGYTVYICSECGQTWETDFIDALGHDTTGGHVVEIPATCTEPGQKEYWVCSRCGDRFFDEGATRIVKNDNDLVIPALGHEWASDFTHDETHHWYKCLRCDAITGKIEHDASNKTVATQFKKADATCQSPAIYYMSCECGWHSEETFTYGDKLEHDLKEVPASSKPCAPDGNRKYWVCKRNGCGMMFADSQGLQPITMDQLRAPHTPDKNWDADENGHYKRCSVCGELLETGSHSFYQTHDAENHWLYCEICGYKDESSVEPHDFVSMGDGREKCTVCGYIRVPAPEPGGLDADFVNKNPDGSIEVKQRQGNNVIVGFIEKKDSYPCDRFEWRLDGVTVEGETGSEFIFDAPQKRNYKVMCIYRNQYGVGSMSLVVPGGGKDVISRS